MTALAFDTETKGLDWWKPEQQAFLVTWADADGQWWADLSDRESTEVGRFLAAVEAADTLIAHNAKFDVHMIRETLGVDLAAMGKVIEDTDLMSRVIHPEGQRKGERGGHGLKNLAAVYLRVDAKDPEDAIKEMAKSIGLRTIKQTGAYYEVYRAYPTEMITYAVADARYTYDLYEEFAPEATANAVYELERRVQPILIEAERRGIATDQERVRKFKVQYATEKAQLFERLSISLGEEALGGAGSEQALEEALLKNSIPLHQRTPTGQLSTSKFALQEFEADHPLIADLLEYRRVERFLNTYIGPMDGVEVVHPSFGQIGAWTGRMSCWSPNMQNFPKRAGKEVRSVIVPRAGHAFVVCDYEGIESRLLAYYLGDPQYRELVAERDPHAWMAAQIWGGSVEDYMKGTDKAITHRQPAKNIMFAITYGAGRKRVAAMLRDAGMPSTLDDAGVIISKIKASLPNYYYLTKHRIEPKVKQQGYVNTIIGRKNPVSRNKAYVGLNALIQGSAADIFKLGVVAVNDAVVPFGAVPLLFVHDEVVVEAPLGTEREVLAATEAAMLSAWDLTPPLGVEGTVAYKDYSEA